MTDRHALRRRHPALRRANLWSLLGGVALACGFIGTPTTAPPARSTAAPAPPSPHTGFDRYRGDARKAAGKRRAQNGYNWSGYVAGGQSFTTASASWTVPDISCSAPADAVAEWVGLDGWGNGTVEQIGIQETCETGVPSYANWVEFYPKPPEYLNDRVLPGDRIHAQARFVSGTTYELSMHDETQGWVENKKVDGWNAANASAEVIVESNRRSFPRFDRIDFTQARFNGLAPGSVNAVNLWASNRGRQQDETSPLYGPELDSFSVAYLAE
ncbi:G1 family glutamic endopeptidase [Streptomyces sp. NPDC002537]